MNIQTYKLTSLWFVTKPYRSDLSAFCSDIKALKDKVFELSEGYQPVVYEVQFWLAKPKFKKLTKIQLKKLIADNLAEKTPGRAKDYNNYNRAEKWETPLKKRKVPARNARKTTRKR